MLVMKSIKRKINSNCFIRQHCFELFGFDFMVDENLKVWLIEVNTNPCLEESGSLLQMVLPRMIDHMLQLSVDQCTPSHYI